MSEFTEWMLEEAKKRDWNDAELAKAADVSSALISLVVNELKKPGLKLCIGLAQAFGYDPEEVMMRAGLIPRSTRDMSLSEWVAVGRQLTVEERRDLMDWALAKIAKRGK